MPQIYFHLTFIFVFLAFMGIRAFYYRKASTQGGEVEYKEANLTRFRRIAGLPFPILLLAYMIRPSWFGGFALPFPAWVQWLGVALGLLSLPLSVWVQWALDINFSHILHLRREHTLITHGPYKWLRHPMYTTLYLNGLATLLITRNWLVGGTYLFFLTLIVILRLKNEEALLIEKFGDQYRSYMQRTGRFLPGF